MITHYNGAEPARNLPDAYAKAAGSNNAKLLEINRLSREDMRAALRAMENSLDLDRAIGATLDMYGAMVGQTRGKATDDQYRVLIRLRIMRNMVGGDYGSVVRVLALIFGCEAREIALSEPAPCTVSVDALPYAAINRMVIDIDTAERLISECMPAGVQLQAVQMTGTFEFSGGTELVYDAEAGFGDISQTIGGYMGLIFGGAAVELPV